MAPLAGTLSPGEGTIQEARDKAIAGLVPRGTHEVGTRFVTRIVPIHVTFSSIRNVELSRLPPCGAILLLTLSSVNANIVPMTIWVPDLSNLRGPRYLAIADALASDIRSSRLSPGDRLPTHRELAYQLGVTVGTVTRAYGEAERRGLIGGEVGRGTFVRSDIT